MQAVFSASQNSPSEVEPSPIVMPKWGLEMREGDTFLFSSKTIPGNERGVIRVMNAFSEMGVDVMDDAGGRYHVSGHANRPDLELMHEIIKPQMLIPMHGEHRHLREHAKLAEARGIPAEIATNGMMIELAPDGPQVAEYIETGRTYLDGTELIGALDGVVRDRIRMAVREDGKEAVTFLVKIKQAIEDPARLLLGV